MVVNNICGQMVTWCLTDALEYDLLIQVDIYSDVDLSCEKKVCPWHCVVINDVDTRYWFDWPNKKSLFMGEPVPLGSFFISANQASWQIYDAR